MVFKQSFYCCLLTYREGHTHQKSTPLNEFSQTEQTCVTSIQIQKGRSTVAFAGLCTATMVALSSF